MKIARKTRRHTSQHGQPVILFAAGEHTFAAPANEVDEIRDLQGLSSVDDATEHTSVSKVKATLERSKKSFYVVDACQHFRQGRSTPSRLIVLRDHPIAVLVDSIDRMMEVDKILPLPRAFGGQERTWYSGLALINDAVVPVVNMSSFLSPAEQVMAKSAVTRLAKGVMA